MSLSEMAAQAGISERDICFHLDAEGIEAAVALPPIILNARKQGAKSLAEYFRKNTGKSFQNMAEDLGVAHNTVAQYYQIFVETVGE